MNRNPQDRITRPAHKRHHPSFQARQQQTAFQWLLEGISNMPLRLQEDNSPATTRLAAQR